jgi:hypothetical protein
VRFRCTWDSLHCPTALLFFAAPAHAHAHPTVAATNASNDVFQGDSQYSAAELSRRYGKGGSAADSDLSASQLRARYAIPNNTHAEEGGGNKNMLIAVVVVVILAGAAFFATQ